MNILTEYMTHFKLPFKLLRRVQETKKAEDGKHVTRRTVYISLSFISNENSSGRVMWLSLSLKDDLLSFLWKL